MVDMRVDVAVGEEPDEMEGRAVVFDVGDHLFPGGAREERAGGEQAAGLNAQVHTRFARTIAAKQSSREAEGSETSGLKVRWRQPRDAC